jgi:hypothetical protein
VTDDEKRRWVGEVQRRTGWDLFEPWLRGSDTFDNCAARLVDRLVDQIDGLEDDLRSAGL